LAEVALPARCQGLYADDSRRSRHRNDNPSSAHAEPDREDEENERHEVRRFSEVLAEDFISQFPGVTRNRAEFLDYIPRPRPFKDLAMHDVNDVALIHGRATYTMLADGVEQEGLYTDVYQRRKGAWVCVAACAIAPGA
jgi:hypothetical protein